MTDDLSLVLQRGVRRGLLTLTRERGHWHAGGAILGILFLGQLLVLLCFTVQATQHLLRTRTDLRLEIRREAADQDVREFFAAVRELPSVQDSAYITRQQAYEKERQHDPDLIAFLEQYKLENPFPDTIAVTLRELRDYDSFAAFVRQSRWSHVVDPQFLSHITDQEAQVQELLGVTQSGKILVSFFLALVGGILLVVLVSLVRARALARRDEILLERLAGAGNLSILMPPATEAAVLLMASVILSAVFLLVFLLALPALVPALQSEGTLGALRSAVLDLLQPYLPLVFIAELIASPLLAFLGAFLGMRGQLRSGKLRLMMV